MKVFRKTIFWLHLVAGLVAGLIIFIMSFTGTILAFEDELVAWAERDARLASPPNATATLLSRDELLTKFRQAQPDIEPTAITQLADPAAAIVLRAGRRNQYYVNPYTAALQTPRSHAMHDFMDSMVSWHRWLGRTGDSRATGKAITGACNAAFVVLALTGLYLWWPRIWRLKAVARSFWLVGAKGKARDWNWHNAFGFWALLPILVMAVSGMVISYKWAGDLVFRVMGEEPPRQARGPGNGGGDLGGLGSGGPGGGGGGLGRERPSAATGEPASIDAFFTAIQTELPDWTEITLNLPSPTRPTPTTTAQVKLPSGLPRTGSTTLTLDTVTTEVQEHSVFGDQPAGRQARSWLRFLHTGQALGWPGQLVAGLGCIAGCLLVYTGFALSWRRFFGKTAKATA